MARIITITNTRVGTWDLPEEKTVVDLVGKKETCRQVFHVPCFSTVRSVLERVQPLV